MEVVTTEILPPEASRSGTNTCYCHCQALNKRSNYGVCLFTLEAFEQGRLREDSDCYSVASRGDCAARRYRQQERDAGRALFYKKREIPIAIVPTEERSTADRNSDSFKRGWARPVAPVTSKPVLAEVKPVPRKKPSLEINGSMAEAVNEAMKQELAKPKEVIAAPVAKTAVTPIPVKSSKPLSLLERARMAITK